MTRNVFGTIPADFYADEKLVYPFPIEKVWIIWQFQIYRHNVSKSMNVCITGNVCTGEIVANYLVFYELQVAKLIFICVKIC